MKLELFEIDPGRLYHVIDEYKSSKISILNHEIVQSYPVEQAL
jgi:hypothetical protein